MMKSKKFTPTPNKILGIDPGYGRIGIAIVESRDRNPKLIYSECFETGSNLPHPKRLALIARKIEEIILEFKPERAAVETLLWSKNVKTALQVAEARGVIIAEVAVKNLPVFEFNPNQIKLAVTGYGKSGKEQVIKMINKTMGIKHKIKYDDEYDAIAAAVTAAVIPSGF